MVCVNRSECREEQQLYHTVWDNRVGKYSTVAGNGYRRDRKVGGIDRNATDSDLQHSGIGTGEGVAI